MRQTTDYNKKHYLTTSDKFNVTNATAYKHIPKKKIERQRDNFLKCYF